MNDWVMIWYCMYNNVQIHKLSNGGTRANAITDGHNSHKLFSLASFPGFTYAYSDQVHEKFFVHFGLSTSKNA